MAATADGKSVVTAGAQHLRFWPLEDALRRGQPVFERMEGSAALFGTASSAPQISRDIRDADFLDVVAGYDGTATAGFVYVGTSTGMLCRFAAATRMLHSWVDLRAGPLRALSLSDGGLVACGCAAGTVRLFDAVSMAYVCTLPKPAPLRVEKCSMWSTLHAVRASVADGLGGSEFADAVCCRCVGRCMWVGWWATQSVRRG